VSSTVAIEANETGWIRSATFDHFPLVGLYFSHEANVEGEVVSVS